MFKFGKSSQRNMHGVHHDLIKAAELAITLSNVDFGIPSTGGLRTAAEQNELFLDNKSKADGYDKKSYHQTGRALDVFAYVDGKASWKEEHLALVACAMLEAASQLGVRLEWGGHWSSFKDMPHFQLGE